MADAIAAVRADAADIAGAAVDVVVSAAVTMIPVTASEDMATVHAADITATMSTTSAAGDAGIAGTADAADAAVAAIADASK